MEITQIVVVGIVSAVLAIIIKKQSPELGLAISIIASILIFMLLVPKLEAVFTIINNISSSLDVNITYISIIFKIIGIAYIAEFGSQICKDAGEASIASKIDLAGKALIMSISAPILLALVDLIVHIIP
ncbi:MAG: stage III sporulation protein AD [Clostridiales bacterium]|jgi:stage III sporulation protein AD|nr:stage III sporulation protein AD [Clostridiales bacterium]